MNVNPFNGGKETPTIGVIKLDTNFKRILGDIGNVNTWDFPVIYETMEGIIPEKAVFHTDYEILIKAKEAAKILEEKGVSAITTSCGFLGKYQKKISNYVKIPVFTSSLLQIPLVYMLLNKDIKIGVLSANSKSLTKEHLAGCDIKDIPLIIKGMEDYEYFQEVFIRDQLRYFDRDIIQAEIIEAVIDLKKCCNNLGAVVLECTNMPPYAYSIKEIVNLPVFDIYTLMNWVYSGLLKQKFD